MQNVAVMERDSLTSLFMPGCSFDCNLPALVVPGSKPMRMASLSPVVHARNLAAIRAEEELAALRAEEKRKRREEESLRRQREASLNSMEQLYHRE